MARRRTSREAFRGVLVLGVLGAGLVAIGCGTSGRAAAGRAPIVGVGGRIGTLRIDASGRAAVVAFVGRPAAEKHGRTDRGGRYDALGYRCAARSSDNALPLVHGGPYCRTVFFIEPRSGRLGLFYTSDARYVESHGVRVGMGTAKAERLLKKRLHAGCEYNIYLYGRDASLTIAFTGGALQHDGTLRGGRVSALVLHGMHHDPGVFECT